MGLSSLAHVTFTLPVALTGAALGVIVQDLAVSNEDVMMVLRNNVIRCDHSGLVLGLNSPDVNRGMRLLGDDGASPWIHPDTYYSAVTVIHHRWDYLEQFDDVDPDAVFHAVLGWAVQFRQLAMAKVN